MGNVSKGGSLPPQNYVAEDDAKLRAAAGTFRPLVPFLDVLGGPARGQN